MTAFSLSQGVRWPYYTHPDYEVFGNSIRNVSGAQLVSWSPVVAGSEKKKLWGTYSVENDVWVREGLIWSAENEGVAMPLPPYDIPNEIYRYNSEGVNVDESGDGPFVPVWQMAGAPSEPSVVNFNLMTDIVFHQSFSFSRDNETPVLSRIVDASKLYGSAAVVDPEDDMPDPQSLMVTPVYSDYSTDSREVVGCVVAVLPWDVYFKDLFQTGTPGIYVVVSDGDCGNEFTYEIIGVEANYLGEGDLHDSQYDEYVRLADFAATITPDSPNGGAQCNYSLSIYPSDRFYRYEDYATGNPIVWTTVVVSIFVIASTIFLVYDCVVQRRQQKVMISAARTNAIVSSLFPAEIRDRLFGNEDDNQKGKSTTMLTSTDLSTNFPESSKCRLKSYLAEEHIEVTPDEDTEGTHKESRDLMEAVAAAAIIMDLYDTKPIADLVSKENALLT
jgi:hypothetical protein